MRVVGEIFSMGEKHRTVERRWNPREGLCLSDGGKDLSHKRKLRMGIPKSPDKVQICDKIRITGNSGRRNT